MSVESLLETFARQHSQYDAPQDWSPGSAQLDLAQEADEVGSEPNLVPDWDDDADDWLFAGPAEPVEGEAGAEDGASLEDIDIDLDLPVALENPEDATNNKPWLGWMTGPRVICARMLQTKGYAYVCASVPLCSCGRSICFMFCTYLLFIPFVAGV